MGSSNETSAYGPVISPWRRKGSNVGADPGRLVGRVGGGGRGAASRRARPAPTPAARSASPRPSPAFAGSSRPTAAARAGGSSPSPARSTRPGRWRGRVRDCAILLEAMAGFDPEGFDLARPAGAAVGSEFVERSQGQARRHSQGISHRRRARRHQRAVGPGHRMAEGRGRDAGRDQPAAHQICAPDLLHHRAGRSLVQPRPL